MSKCEWIKCENCIHDQVCEMIGTGTMMGICSHYKPKSLFVELPCRCKDCKYLRKNFVGTYYCDNEKNGAAKRHTDLNEYCSYAELKEMGCEYGK